MFHTNRLFSRKHESQTIPRLRRNVGFVIPARDVVFQFLLLCYQRGFLLLQAIQFSHIQRIGVECRRQLDSS